MTEDNAEMEEFLMAIPGSFSTDWDTGAWKKVGSMMEDESEVRSPNEVVEPRTDTTVPTIQAMPLVVRRPLCSVSIRSVLRQITPHHPPANIMTLPPEPYSPHISHSRQGYRLQQSSLRIKVQIPAISKMVILARTFFPPIGDTLSQA